MKLKICKTDFTDIVRSALLSVVICLVGILLFAVVIRFTDIPDNVIMPINIIIKTIAIAAGVIFGLRTAEHGAVKGLLTGLLFSLITYLLFSIISGDFSVGAAFWIDCGILVGDGVLAGIVVVNIKSRKG